MKFTKNIIVFLDIDGVLNHEDYLKYSDNTDMSNMLDPKAINLINDLLQATKAKIVISSSWRLGHSLNEIQNLFQKVGFHYPERIIGATIDLPNKPRGDEIALWLAQVPIDAFVIFDDDEDMSSVQENLIQTQFVDGLQKIHIDLAKKLILKQLKNRKNGNDSR